MKPILAIITTKIRGCVIDYKSIFAILKSVRNWEKKETMQNSFVSVLSTFFSFPSTCHVCVCFFFLQVLKIKGANMQVPLFASWLAPKKRRKKFGRNCHRTTVKGRRNCLCWEKLESDILLFRLNTPFSRRTTRSKLLASSGLPGWVWTHSSLLDLFVWDSRPYICCILLTKKTHPKFFFLLSFWIFLTRFTTSLRLAFV